jgi:hypothetical protein
MPPALEIENIEALRRHEGIEDTELHEQVRHLRVGSCVKLTLVAVDRPGSGGPILVRITSIKGEAFRGRVVCAAGAVRLPASVLGSLVAFTEDHIHSVPKAPQGNRR